MYIGSVDVKYSEKLKKLYRKYSETAIKKSYLSPLTVPNGLELKSSM